MSFGSNNNPPWQRSMGNAGSGGGQQQQIPSLQSQMGLPNPNIVGFQGQQSIYSTNMTMGHQQQQHQNNSNQMSMIPSLVGGSGGGGNNLNSNQMYNQTVAYPTRGGGGTGGLNPNAFGHQNNTPVPVQQTTSRVGVVTKIQNDFGFIDEEVFFHKNSCKGNYPKLGDRVLVEAAFSTNAAFKWNATRVQLMGSNGGGNSNNAPGIVNSRNHHQQGSGGGGGGNNQRQGSGYNAVPPPNAYAGGFERSGQPRRGNVPATSPLPHPRRSSPSDKHSSRNHDSRADDEDRKRRREDREKEKDRVKEKREHSVEKRDHSPSSRRAASPKRRRTRVSPRYMVRIPKVTLDMVEADVMELRRRYTNLYIPSDFFFTEIRWTESFPPNATFSIQKPCAFHIKHRSVESVHENDAVLHPPDVDYLFSAKVMLMGIPPMSEIYRQCFSAAEEKERDDERTTVHPTRLINFLVGIRGKNEAMAIGGPWSPSVDGPSPDRDPSVLIRTAIRTCKSLTGIDLTPCTQWYRFVELYYRRSESVRKGRTIPARVETVVIYLPDVRSCVPTRLEWDALNVSYKQKLEQVTRRSQTAIDTASAAAGSIGLGNSNNDTNQSSSSSNVIADGDNSDVGVAASAATATVLATTTLGGVSGAAADAEVDATTEKDDAVPATKRNPSNFADLDPKTMKLVELREELEARNLSARGLKPQLVARLSKVLKAEETESNLNDEEEEEDNHNEEEEASDVPATAAANEDGIGNGSGGGADIDMADIVVIDEYDSTKPEVKKSKEDEPKPLDERERRVLEKRYQLPENPHLIVHPSRTAKQGKFFINEMSLSILLDYRPEDSKEHSFEVSLFAELFNEMLMRDFGFNIYKALCAMPEKTKEEEEAAAAVAIASNEKDNKDTKERKESEAPKEKRSRKDDDTDRKSDAADKIESLADKDKSNDSTENKDRRVVKDSSRSADNKDKDRKRRRDDDADDDTQSIRSSDPKKKDKDRLKQYTADSDLLLSFVYFDTTHCGYIFEKDLEELFYTLGLHLSRAQTRKLVSKVVSRDSLFYRKLTDKPREEKLADGTVVATAEPAAAQDSNTDLVLFDIDEISKGNKRYMPIFRMVSNNAESSTLITNNHENNTADEGISQTGMVLYKGAFVDIEKLLDQMRRSEKARDDTEQMLVDLRKTNAELLASNTRSKDKIKDLQSDVKSYSRKLSDVEQTLSSTSKKSSEYHSILSSVYDRVSVVFAKSERSTSKNDTSREKDKERGEKKERNVKEKEITEDREKEKEDTKDAIKTEVKKE